MTEKVIDLQKYRAVIDAMKALDEFEKFGGREAFRRWLEKYNKKEDKKCKEQENTQS